VRGYTIYVVSTIHGDRATHVVPCATVREAIGLGTWLARRPVQALREADR
jgi:hypothetical protein